MRIGSPRLARAFTRPARSARDEDFLSEGQLPAAGITTFSRACAACALGLGLFLLVTRFVPARNGWAVLLSGAAVLLLSPRRKTPKRLAAAWLILWGLTSLAIYIIASDRPFPPLSAAAWLALAASLTLSSMSPLAPVYPQLLALIPLYIGARGILGAAGGSQADLGQAEAALGMMLVGFAAFFLRPDGLASLFSRRPGGFAFAAPSREQADAQLVFERGARELNELIKRTNALIVCRQLPSVSCDEVALKLIFQCLIARAIAARGEEPPRIKVTAHAHSEGWLFIIEDNGVGLAAAACRPLPDPRPALARCKQLVEQFGGSFWMQSSTGNGSTFCFILPATREVTCNSLPQRS